jgi:adenylylsulfate reductase subunit A
MAVGAGARKVNALGQLYEEKYGNTTSQRVLACTRENEEGRGPCRLVGTDTRNTLASMARAYFHMAPLQALRFLEDGDKASRNPEQESGIGAFIEGTEPYIIGGHTASGYFINSGRETTLKGLYAIGDAAGGAPQKYVSGAIAEAMIASESVSGYLSKAKNFQDTLGQVDRCLDLALRHLSLGPAGFDTDSLEEAMQKSMDTRAGGRSAFYRYSKEGLSLAKKEIREIYELSLRLPARTPRELSRLYELKERLVVSFSLISHLLNRKETRWPGFGEYFDYPREDPRYELFLNSKISDYLGFYPEAGLSNVTLLARDLKSSKIIPLPEPQEDPPLLSERGNRC